MERAAATMLTSAVDALRDEEVERTRTFLRIGWIAAAGAVLAVLAVPGDRRIAAALLACLATFVAGSVWIYRTLGQGAGYHARRLHALVFAALACGQLGTLYVGAFSAAPAVIALGVLLFCRTEHRASAIGVYAVAAGLQAALATLVITGAIDDPGFYRVRQDCSIEAQIAGQLILQQVYALCFFLARMTRRSSLRAIEHLQRATRLAAQRDAQVAELRSDLDRALKIGGPGRFSGHAFHGWELGAVLGRGAMGEVYEAVHAATGRPAAVKLLRRELLGDPRHVERFLREVRIAGAIDSPHVVAVLDAPPPTPHEPLPFLAMERLHGRTLGELLRTGPFTGAPLSQLVAEVAEVLDRARAAGVVHRDLKPHNLFLTDAGTGAGIWKVLDFGVAVLGETSGTLTRGAAIGTPAYMAPEQARGEPVDHRADLYALGAVIYRCLTGRVPFVARDTPALLYAVVHIMPLRPSALAPVPPHVEAFLQIALAKARDARFPSGAELAAAFAAAEGGALPDLLLRRARELGRELPWTEPEVAEHKAS